MEFNPIQRINKNVNMKKVENYQIKINYFEYTDNQEEVEILKHCEETIFFAEGRMAELNKKRWDAILKMQSILKTQREFQEVLKKLGISKDIKYDLNLREKLYKKSDVSREEIAELPVRAVRKLNKYNFPHNKTVELIREPEKIDKAIKELSCAPKQSITPKKTLEQERVEEIQLLKEERDGYQLKIDKINKRLEELNYFD